MALTTITDRPEIVLFDIETAKFNEDWVIIEFGAIVLCPNTLKELDRYSEFIRPIDPTLVQSFRNRENGITREAIASARYFKDAADKIYQLLDGRIWAGHNMRDFDGPVIQKAFEDIKELAPKPKGIFDSLEFLRPDFERRVGSMKLKKLARYFHLGDQPHRSLADCLMNLDIIKFCSTVLFLESSLPGILTDDIGVPLDDFENDNTSIPPVSVTLANPFSRGPSEILLLHRDQQLKLFCENLKICYDISDRYVDYRGRPKLNFVVFAPEKLCRILEMCDSLAQKLWAGCGSNSQWQPVMQTTDYFDGSPSRTVRLKLLLDKDSDLETEIYHEDDSGTKHDLTSTFLAAMPNPLLKRGNLVDASFSVETYDCKGNAGLRLVAKKLIVREIDKMSD